MSLRYIRHLLNSYALWRQRCESRRAIPKLRELDRRRQECRRFHKRGVKAIDREAQRIMHSVLAGERG